MSPIASSERTLIAAWRRGARAATALSLLLLSALALAAPRGVRAQENQVSPPAPLAHPALESNPSASGQIAISLLRQMIETGANVELCKMLMTDAKQPIPQNFDWSKCPANFQNDIAAGNGKVSWASGARPTKCGTSCVGRPFMTQSMFLDRPNTIFAMLYGHLDFAIDVPGPFNRSVTYGYEAQFRCLADGDGSGSHLNVSVVFEQPVVSDPGILESIASFLALPADISDRITNGIRAQLSTPGTTTASLAACTTIGANQATDPRDDAILFDIPRGSTRPSLGAHVGDAVVGRTATVHFLRITRRAPPFGYTPPADPGQFRIFLNGIQGDIPEVPAADLPTAGGSVTLDLCKTIDVNGADRLQIIFANSNGAAAWSQFTSRASFGAGPARTLTTGQSEVVPGLPGPPDPRTGKSAPTKPQTILVQEFDLLYTVEYHAPATTVASSPAPTGGRRPGIGAGVRPVIGPASLGPRPAAPPCRKI